MVSNVIIARDDPASADVRLLIAAHLQFAQCESPPEAVHALAAPALAADGIDLFSARARALYESAGFEVCPPFGRYAANPYSVCLSRTFG